MNKLHIQRYIKLYKLTKTYKKAWYGNKIYGYSTIHKFNAKLLENFLHYIKSEKQTDMEGNEI